MPGWFLSYWRCVICWTEYLVLHPETEKWESGMSCDLCGFVMLEPGESFEVPERLAREEHEAYDVPWEG